LLEGAAVEARVAGAIYCAQVASSMKTTCVRDESHRGVRALPG